MVICREERVSGYMRETELDSIAGLDMIQHYSSGNQWVKMPIFMRPLHRGKSPAIMGYYPHGVEVITT